VLAKLLPGLHTLYTDHSVANYYLTSRGLVQIASSAAQLTELHIGYNNRLNETSFQHLFCSGPPLRKLVVSSNRDVFSHVDRLAESLQFLNIYTDGKLGFPTMQAIGRLANLKSLEISGGGRGSDPQDFFNSVSSGQLLKLRFLHLKMSLVTSENVKIVMMKCPELQELRLTRGRASLDFARVVSTSLQILHISETR
jgi:hypothetical protein